MHSIRWTTNFETSLSYASFWFFLIVPGSQHKRVREPGEAAFNFAEVLSDGAYALVT